MPNYITVAKPPFKTLDELESAMGTSLNDLRPEGMEQRYVGTADGELRIVVLWESKQHADQFFANILGPAIAKTLGPEPAGVPEVTGIDVKRSYVREPVG